MKKELNIQLLNVAFQISKWGVVGFSLILSLLAVSCQSEIQHSYNEGISIIPMPHKMEIQQGSFDLNKRTILVIPDSLEMDASIALFSEKVKTATGFDLKIAPSNPTSNYIEFRKTSICDFNPEGYILNVNQERITLEARTQRGFFYGLQTILQLLPAEIESPTVQRNINWKIPCVNISDNPRFTWRGMHLDVCRHFLPVENIKKHLDMMTIYKLNTFHWHLTDDQAWRIEIKKYPLLTQLGATRTEEDGTVISGFYSQEQIRDVVEYAQRRFINVVPEIEMPGHALAALTPYPEYSCTGGPFSPRTVWGVEEDVFCAGNDQTFVFLEDIIDEVASLFPYDYFHIGGDESPKDRWEKCPKCQKRMRDEGLKNEHELQSYFVERIEKVVLKHNKKMVGWDEILEGGLAKSATVMSWRGENGGIEAATSGHDVVMTPGSHCYLDHYQGSSKVEPVAIGGYTPLEKVYEYEPVPSALDAQYSKHILGTQGNVWAEYMYSPDRVEYFVYPRILALAEVGWSLPEHKDFKNFTQRLNNQFVRMDLRGINYHIPLPEGPCNSIAFVDSATLVFSTTRPVTMVYTLNGDTPDKSSKRYENPLIIKNNTVVNIATLLETGRMSAVRTIAVTKQDYAVAQNVDNLEQGISMKTRQGIFQKVSDLDSVSDWESTIISALDLTTFFNYKNPSAVIAKGFISIPEDGIYRFSTDVDQFYINNQLLISNEGELKKHSRNDASMALAKGFHGVRLVALNNVFRGWPMAWSGIQVWCKKSDDEKFQKINTFYHQH